MLRFVFILLVFATTSTQVLKAQNDANIVAYVWDFTSVQGDFTKLATDFTEEFEEALIGSNCCKMLQRRSYSMLFAQKENEKEIVSLDGISGSKLDNLKALKANAVVFGQIDDDKESGQIKISVSFESFNGQILAKESVYLSRGKRHDPQSRQSIMEKLVEELPFTNSQEGFNTNSNLKSDKRGGKLPKEVNNSYESVIQSGLEFTAASCTRIKSRVYCSVSVKSLNENLKAGIFNSHARAPKKSKLIDSFGIEHKIETLKFGTNIIYGHSSNGSNNLIKGISSNIRFSISDKKKSIKKIQAIQVGFWIHSRDAPAQSIILTDIPELSY